MINCIRTDSGNTDFIALVKELDADLAIRDGDEHAFYAQFNKIDKLKHVVVAYLGSQPIGCGAIKEYEAGTVELKRMFVLPSQRGRGIASIILQYLEDWGREMNYQKCILETGVKQPEAIGLYKKRGYRIIENYGQYINVLNSICFEKIIAGNKL